MTSQRRGRAWRLTMAIAVVLSAAACDELRTATEPLPIGATLLVAPAGDTLFIADTVQEGDSVRFLTSLRTYSGDTVDFTGASWSSSDTLVATVDSTGLVRARGLGEAIITAEVDRESASATIVIAPATAALLLLPDIDTLVLGDSLQLFAQAYDAGGAPVGGVRYDFTSSAEGVATVDSLGLVRAVGEGDAQITVSAAGRQAFSDITVIDTLSAPIFP